MDSNILSVILYGSFARNDHDSMSDLDICVLIKDDYKKNIDFDEIKSFVTITPPKIINIISYSSSSIDEMLKYGSMFLFHLKLEGKVLYGKNYFNKIINRLKPFRHHREEILYLLDILNDLLSSYKKMHLPNEMDLAILFTISRNTCMILAHKMNEFIFGRQSCYLSAKTLFPTLPLQYDDYLYLSKWKMIYERCGGPSSDLPNKKDYEKFLNKIERLLIYAEAKTRKNM